MIEQSARKHRRAPAVKTFGPSACPECSRDGFVEAIDDNTLKNVAAAQPGRAVADRENSSSCRSQKRRHNPRRPLWMERPASQLAFVRWRRLCERTRHHQPAPARHLHRVRQPRSRTGNDIDQFATFMRNQSPPRRPSAQLPTQAGQQIFFKIGCSVTSITTVPTDRAE
jgi:hypothetical protein